MPFLESIIVFLYSKKIRIYKKLKIQPLV